MEGVAMRNFEHSHEVYGSISFTDSIIFYFIIFKTDSFRCLPLTYLPNLQFFFKESRES